MPAKKQDDTLKQQRAKMQTDMLQAGARQSVGQLTGPNAPKIDKIGQIFYLLEQRAKQRTNKNKLKGLFGGGDH